MPLIHSTSNLASIIRAQIAAQPRWNDLRLKSSSPAPSIDDANHHISPDDSQKLQTIVANRINALGSDVPQRQRRAFQIFLESVLILEFGQTIVLSPDFDNLINQVISQMERDPELDKLTVLAGELLLPENLPEK